VPYEGIVGTDSMGGQGSYLVFVSMTYGVRAIAMCLKAYALDHGIDTLRATFERWAPSGDNNQPAAYARVVADALGVGIDDTISLTDPATLLAVIRAIVRVENGPPPVGQAQWVDDATLQAGVKLAG
jgi:hypothetical protein